MAAPDKSRRHDTRRRKTQPVESADSDALSDNVEDPQARASRHPKKPQKYQEPTHITFQIHGPVTISNIGGDFLGQEGGNERRRRQPSPLSSRSSAGRLQAGKRRPRGQCDSQTEPETDSEAGTSSSSEASASRNRATNRVTKSKASLEGPRHRPGHNTKRYQPDEGYLTGSTASYSLEVPINKKSAKGKGRTPPPTARSDNARHARLSTSTTSRRSKSEVVETDGEYTDPSSEEDNDGADEGDRRDEEEDASDDDFAQLCVQVSSKDFSKSVDEKAVLDTGTKPDWISATFYDELKNAGIPVEKVRLSEEEKKIKYSDFNNKKFSPTSKVELMIQSDEFSGMKCRQLSFYVASKATFSILIGRDTIRKQKLMTRGKPDPDGEGVFVGVHGEMTDEEKTAMKKKRDERDKLKEGQKKKREAKLEEIVKPKAKMKTPSNQVAAHLATTVTRNSKTGSPPKGGRHPSKQLERQSDSSLEEACW